MRKTSMTAALLLMLGTALPVVADWEIGFGNEKNQVGLVAPKGAEDFPVGPGSYRLINDTLWVLDSAGGAIKCFDESNRLVDAFSLPVAAGFILDDFAVMLSKGLPEAVVVVDSMNRQIVKTDLKGKELLKIRVEPEKLIQMDEVGIDSNGQIYVGDYANSYIAVFAADGSWLRTIPWQCSGFVVDQNDQLHTIVFAEGKGHSHVVFSAVGKETARTDFGMAEVQNPRIWNVSDNGDILVSVVPPEGDPNSHLLLTLSASGEIVARKAFRNPYYINRYLAAGKDTVWLVNADYMKSSDKIRVQPLK
jgi:hypothetical protein